MKKNIKILIIVLVAAVLLVGLMLLLIFMPKGGDQTTATYDEGVALSTSVDENGVHNAKVMTNSKGEIENNSYGTLMEYVPAEISKIHLENKKGTLDITSYTPTNEKGETDTTQYTVVGYDDFELQTGIADEIANDAASISFSKVMTLEKSKAADYGLDKPRAIATATYTDDTKCVIYVGDDAPQGAGTYIKFGIGDEVYLVETSAVSAFDYGLTDLMSLTINDSAADDTNAQAGSITLSGANFPNTIVLEPNSSEKVSASYVMTSPTNCYADENEASLVEGAIRGLYANSVKMVNPSSAQLDELGLQNAYAHIKAVYPDETVELSASKPDGEGNVYVMESGGKVVYVMSADKLPWVSTGYEKLVNKYVLYPKISALSSLNVNDGGKSYSFELSTKTVNDGENETSTTTVKCGGKEIDLGYFQTFYQNIVMTELSDVKSVSAGNSPVFTATYNYSDGSADTVSFYADGSNKCIAVVNGQTMGYVYRSRVNSLVQQAGKIAQNTEVETLS